MRTTQGGRIKPRLLVLLIAATAIFSQLYLLSLSVLATRTTIDVLGGSIQGYSKAKLVKSVFPSKNRNSDTRNASRFGACLMTKLDNDLLYEWLAYHRVVLPLTHVILGSDFNNTDDPTQVLRRMEGLFDYATIIDASDFAERHGPLKMKTKKETPKQAAHHALIHRQKGFLTTCLERLRSMGVHWTLLVDSDEYLVFHTAASQISMSNHHESATVVPSLASNMTILDLLERHYNRDSELNHHSSTACVTVPRLLVGSLENLTCSNNRNAIPSNSSMNNVSADFGHLHTLRFFQHAPPGDFSSSKFAKVLIDLSRINESLIFDSVPRNIHRPYPSVCGKAIVNNIAESPLIIHHYIGSWERYSARGMHDERRNRREWEQRAYVTPWKNDNRESIIRRGRDASLLVPCVAEIQAWIGRFIHLVGSRERAKWLLPQPTLSIAVGKK